MTAGFGRVALPLPLAEPYTYRIPTGLADRVAPGARVVVPVRGRELIGVVVACNAPPPQATPRDILSAPDDEPALSPALLRTAEWIAGYYGVPLGLTLRAMLPSGMWGASRVLVRVRDAALVPGGLGAQILERLETKGGEAPVSALARSLRRPVWDALNRLARVGAVSLEVQPPEVDRGTATERVLRLAGSAPTLLERETIFRRSPAQRRLLELLEELGGEAPVSHLVQRLETSDTVVRGLVRRGLATVALVERIRDPFADAPGVPPPERLTPDQARAITAIEALAGGEGALLFGVTGSGKTLVYLRAIRRELEAGRGAILLVPEISLTPQTVARVRGAFGEQVAVLHSGLSDGERADAWRLLRRGERRVAVGARSAIFAPVKDLGLIILDEEHEATYKNGEAPRYHARDVAVVRARLEGAKLLLGSATPSPESMARVGAGLTLLRLPVRVADRPLPPVRLIDLRIAARATNTGPVPWSIDLDRAVGGTLARGEQVLLLLNRRGFATFLQCPDCGHVQECPNCSISLTVHQVPVTLRCHYCMHQEAVPELCPECAHHVQRMRGIGTQQLERMLGDRFPEARIARMDLDTTSTRWSHHRILSAVERGDVNLLLGTQMIAKGLDFPNVTLVGVVDADIGLHLPDFRAAERTFQLMAQVAGRAGRGPRGGQVLVQTRNPEHHALRWAAAHDPDGFLREELAHRAAPPYPPVVSLVNLVVSGLAEGPVSNAAMGLADWCGALAEKHSLPLTILGPAPCPLARIKERWRWHVLLKGESEVLGRVVRYAAPRITRAGREVRVVIDRDPVSLL